MNIQEQERLIREAAAQFPEGFRLRAFPNDVFSIDIAASFVSEGKVLLYTAVWRDGEWKAFAKGTISELKAQILPTKISEG